MSFRQIARVRITFASTVTGMQRAQGRSLWRGSPHRAWSVLILLHYWVSGLKISNGNIKSCSRISRSSFNTQVPNACADPHIHPSPGDKQCTSDLPTSDMMSTPLYHRQQGCFSACQVSWCLIGWKVVIKGNISGCETRALGGLWEAMRTLLIGEFIE